MLVELASRIKEQSPPQLVKDVEKSEKVTSLTIVQKVTSSAIN